MQIVINIPEEMKSRFCCDRPDLQDIKKICHIISNGSILPEKHGRLIDADELMEHVWRDKLDSRELIAKMIDNAPTVKKIPTEIPINIYEQLISQQSKMGEWIPVNEKLPKIGTNVLCSVNDHGGYYVIITMYNVQDYWSDGIITAWMPLPEPYKAGDTK